MPPLPESQMLRILYGGLKLIGILMLNISPTPVTISLPEKIEVELEGVADGDKPGPPPC